MAEQASQLSLNQAQKINFKMNSISNIFGAKAKIFLQYDGDMETLASLLSAKLLIPKFRIETDQDPPHELLGLCEAFGFDIWLNYSEEYTDFAFEVIIETELKFEESFHEQVYNISPWFARYVSTACQLISCAVDIDGKILYFNDGEINDKGENPEMIAKFEQQISILTEGSTTMGIEEFLLDQAKKEGIEKGGYNKALDIARELKKEGLAIGFIAKTTKLSIEEIEKL